MKLFILLQDLSGAQNQIEKALEAAQGNPEALMAMNRMLFGMLIAVVVLTGAVIIVLWKKNEKADQRDREREDKDNQFKSDFIMKIEKSIDAQSATNISLRELTSEIRSVVNNFINKSQ